MYNPISNRCIKVKEIRIFPLPNEQMVIELCDITPSPFNGLYQYISLDLTYNEFLDHLACWKLIGYSPRYMDRYHLVDEAEFIKRAKRIFV